MNRDVFLRLLVPRSLSTDMGHFINCNSMATGMQDLWRQHKPTYTILSSMYHGVGGTEPSSPCQWMTTLGMPPWHTGRTLPHSPASAKHPWGRGAPPCPILLWQTLSPLAQMSLLSSYAACFCVLCHGTATQPAPIICVNLFKSWGEEDLVKKNKTKQKKSIIKCLRL